MPLKEAVRYCVSIVVAYHMTVTWVFLHNVEQWFTKCCFADHEVSATSSQGIRGNIYVMATLKFTHFF